MPKPRLARLRFVTEPVGGDPTPGAGTPAAPAAPTPQPPAGDPSKDQPLGEPGIKALQAERDARTAAEKALADFRQEIDDSKKTAEQKAADDLAAAQRDAAESTAKALKYEVAATKGIALTSAHRLSGSTLAEIEADADRFKAEQALVPAKGPRPDRSQGGGEGDKGTSVAAGRDLWSERHPPSKTP